MAATLLPNAKQQFLDTFGVPLAGGLVYFYVPNTEVPKNTYQDVNETILNTNPIQLDAGGEAVIWGDGLYRQIVRDSNGVTIWDQVTQGVTSTTTPFPPALPGSAIQTASFQVVSTTATYFCDPASGAMVGTLPTNPVQNVIYVFKDYTGAASPTNTIGINGNGHLIDGVASIANFIQVPYGFGSVQFNGTSWSVLG